MLIVAAGLAVDVALYALLGWRLGGDAPRYLDGAQRLLNGIALTERQLGYVGYIAVIAGFQATGLGLTGVWFFQLALSLIAGCAAFALGRAWFGDRTGLVCGLLWVTFVDIQRWNFYLLSDGPFISAVMICCSLTARGRTAGWPTLGAAVAAIAAMATLRINGVIFAAFFCVYLLAELNRSRRLAIAATLLVLILAVPAGRAVIGFVSRPQTHGELVRQGTYEFLVEGHVIWNTVFVPMPPVDTSRSAGPGDIAAYIADHPLAVARLYALRFGHYVFAYNPQYSTRHRLVNLTLWPLLYLFTLAGLSSMMRQSRWAASLALLWVCQGVLVVLTVGDFDGRYSLYAVPALLPFAAGGVDRLAAAAMTAFGRIAT